MKKKIWRVTLWAIAISAVGAFVACQSDVTEPTAPANPVLDEDMPYWSVYGYVLGEKTGQPYEGYNVVVRCLDCQEDIGMSAWPSSESGYYLVWIGMTNWTAHAGHWCRSIEPGGAGESDAFKLEGGGPTHYLGPINVWILE